jgi:hypothetical protein
MEVNRAVGAQQENRRAPKLAKSLPCRYRNPMVLQEERKKGRLDFYHS